MKTELPKAYEPKLVDPKWATFWQENNFFIANPKSDKPPYCIVIPPPNVTGSLHMGHALVNTLQDVLIRWKRMSGFETLWVPGTDHAGIATQSVVERHLLKTTGKRRTDFSRDEFLSQVWDWKKQYEGNILSQLKKMGCSCDFSRLRFTMDDRYNTAVKTIFKSLFDKGLIYRGDYLVNWDPVLQTALSDDEVEYEEKDSFLWNFKYPLSDNSGFIEISTTRPETMLGDTAIAVSPKDERYKHLTGKTAIQPLSKRELPIIQDPFVDPEFGTGAVKITPAHDPNDYLMGINHKLPFINIMTPDGKVNENGGEFQGLSFEAAREAVIKKMDEMGLFVKKTPHKNRVGISYRSKAVIEPYLSKQWFVNMSGFAKKLKALVEEKKVTLLPKNFENTYFAWVNNLRDWCISRQLWWGHRIPIWHHVNDPNKVICYIGEGVPLEVQKEPNLWKQDEDVLDTWFSSQLFPFAALGWPENTLELQKFYPNSTLITGHDILFFWVARMLAIGEEVMGKAPFKETFLHGLIYGKSYWRVLPQGNISYVTPEERREFDLGKPLPKDVHFKWEKMSKSKGNVIDPIELIETFGTDAMRMTLCKSVSESREIDLDLRQFEELKNFANKIWNGARFVLMNLDGLESIKDSPIDYDLSDRWILQKLSETIKKVNDSLEKYAFSDAANAAYDFFWKEFCAYYVEISKPYLFGKVGTVKQKQDKQRILFFLLSSSLRLLHPMAPFITEELFQILKENFSSLKSSDPLMKEAITSLAVATCALASYPKPFLINGEMEISPHPFEKVLEAVYMIRNIRAETKLPPHLTNDLIVIGNLNSPDAILLKEHLNEIRSLVKVGEVSFVEKEPNLPFASVGTLGALTLMIPLPKELIEAEKIRVEKEKEKLLISIEKLETQLNNKDFVERAPKELLEKQRSALNAAKNEYSRLISV